MARAWTLLLTLAVMGVPALADPPPAPPELVANPEAEVWAKLAPGAWVVRDTTQLDSPPGLAPMLSETFVLAERTEHEVVLWKRSAAQGRMGDGKARLLDRRVTAAEARAPWEREDVVGKVEVKQATWKVGSRDVACTVRTWSSAQVKNEEWRSADVPGAVVRHVQEPIAGAGPAVEVPSLVVTVTDFGATPGSSFTWPLVWDATERLIEDPRAKGWAAFKPGAWARWSMTDTLMRGDEGARVHTERLLEVRPTCVIVRRVSAGAGDRRGRPGDDIDRMPFRVPAHKTNDTKANEAMGYKTTVTEGKETLTIAGKSLECRVETSQSKMDKDPMVITIKHWFHPDVPGHIVKRELTTENGGRTNTNTATVVAFGLAP